MRNLLEAAKNILTGQQLDEAAKGSMPTSEKEKSLAKLASPKDKITHKDVLVGRGVIAKEDFDGFEDIGLTEEEMDQIAEKYMGFEKLKGALASRGAKDPAALAAWIGRKKYGKEKFQKASVAGKMGKGKVLAKEETYEADETIISENAFIIDLPESLQYKDFVQAVLALEGFNSLSDVPEERISEIVECIDIAFNENLEALVVEALTWSEIQDKIAAHKKAGNKIMDVSHGERQGKPYAAYTVVDKDGMKRRHIYHGSTRKVENIGQTTKPGKEDSDE